MMSKIIVEYMSKTIIVNGYMRNRHFNSDMFEIFIVSDDMLVFLKQSCNFKDFFGLI